MLTISCVLISWLMCWCQVSLLKRMLNICWLAYSCTGTSTVSLPKRISSVAVLLSMEMK